MSPAADRDELAEAISRQADAISRQAADQLAAANRLADAMDKVVSSVAAAAAAAQIAAAASTAAADEIAVPPHAASSVALHAGSRGRSRGRSRVHFRRAS